MHGERRKTPPSGRYYATRFDARRVRPCFGGFRELLRVGAHPFDNNKVCFYQKTALPTSTALPTWEQNAWA